MTQPHHPEVTMDPNLGLQRYGVRHNAEAFADFVSTAKLTGSVGNLALYYANLPGKWAYQYDPQQRWGRQMGTLFVPTCVEMAEAMGPEPIDPGRFMSDAVISIVGQHQYPPTGWKRAGVTWLKSSVASICSYETVHHMLDHSPPGSSILAAGAAVGVAWGIISLDNASARADMEAMGERLRQEFGGQYPIVEFTDYRGTE